MERNFAKLRERKARTAAFFKRLRIPLLTVFGTFLTALVILPMAFRALGAPGETVEISAPAATGELTALRPTPTPAPEEAAAPSETLAPEAAPTPENIYTPLAFGDTNAIVLDIQRRLMELWYLESDEPTDYFGPATEAAIKRFQRTHYMTETGVADEMTQRLLFAETATPYVIEEGYSGDDILMLQKRLSELGFYSGKQNGYFGTATFRALSAFQVKNELSSDGCADFYTRELIYSPDARPAVDPTPTPTPKKTSRPSTPKPTKTPRPASTPEPGSSDWEDQFESANTPRVTAEPTATQAPRYTADPIISNGSAGDFLSVLNNQLGKPYVYSNEGPDSFDCSGLVYYCLRSVGVSVGRYSANSLSQVGSWTTVYGKENLRPGDLLFYKSDGSSSTYVTHVGVWIGGNQLLHASTSAGKVCVTNWGRWSDDNFLFAKRVFD